MPLVLVHAPAVGDVDELLAAVASATAEALRLADGDVIATLVATRGLAISGHAGQSQHGCWPLLSFHGRHRDSAATAEAFAQAARAVEAWAAAARLELVGMSTEWVLPLPPVRE